jgi:hypothetical protein
VRSPDGAASVVKKYKINLPYLSTRRYVATIA